MRLIYMFVCFGMALGQDLDVMNGYNFDVMKNWRNDCSKMAIQELTPQCYNGIESLFPEQQKNLAVELSICEFENANICYPTVCKERKVDDCIKCLEKSPQFWTTFSGYYREVKTICHELSLPFEKDQILVVYENITELYKQLVQDLKSSNKQSEQAQNILKTKFEKLIKIVDSIIIDRDKQRDNLNHTFVMFQENFESSLNNAVAVLQQSYNGANTNIKEMEQHLNYFAQDILQVHSFIRDRIDDLQLQQDKLQDNNDQIYMKTENTLGKLESINKNIDEMNELNKNIVRGMQNHLEYSEFSVLQLNHHIQQSINDIELQRKYITLQGPVILEKIAEVFVQQLNHSATDIVESLGYAMNTTLEKINNKMKATEVSLDNINTKAQKFASLIESVTGYLVNFANVPKMFKTMASNTMKKVSFLKDLITSVLIVFFLIIVMSFFKLLGFLPWKICSRLCSEFVFILAPAFIGIIFAAVILVTLKYDKYEDSGE